MADPGVRGGVDACDRVEPELGRGGLGGHFQLEQLERIERLAGVGIWEWNIATGAVTWSPALYRLFGVDEAAAASYEAFIERVHVDDRQWVEREIAAVAAHGHPLGYEARVIAPDGQLRWIAVHGEVATDAHGAAFLTGTVHDLTDRKIAQLELARQATTDVLTGLANRAVLADRLDSRHGCQHPHRRAGGTAAGRPRRVQTRQRHPRPCGGDTVLAHVASQLEHCIRPGDTLARVGGDEFAILLPGADVHEAGTVADRLTNRAATPVAIDDIGEVAVGASVGIAVSTTPPQGAGELRREADLALYTAKRNGSGQHAVFNPTAHEDTTAECLMVDPDEARAWACYLRALRADIAAAKHSGALPQTSRAPDSLTRTLHALLGAIDALPHHTGTAPLVLPDRAALEEFVFHHALVQHWADGLVRQGILGTRRPSAPPGSGNSSTTWPAPRHGLARPSEPWHRSPSDRCGPQRHGAPETSRWSRLRRPRAAGAVGPGVAARWLTDHQKPSLCEPEEVLRKAAPL